MTVSTSVLSFRAVDQNLWAPGAAIELGIDTGDALIFRPDELTYDLNIGGSFLGFSGELYANFVFGLFAYAEIGEAGRFGGGIDIIVNARHNAVVSGNGEGITFDFSDYTVASASIVSQGFSVGAKAGIDLVVGFELGVRDLSYAVFGFQDTADDFKIIDVPETNIPLITVEPFQTELPFDLGFGLELTLRVPSGADTEGASFGSVVVRSNGVSDSPFIELSADLDEMLIELLRKIPFPPLAVVANALQNSIFAEFEFDLNDYVPGIGAGIFGVSATVLDIGASIGAAVSEELALDFSNGDGVTPDVNITLRSDNGTPGDLSDDVITFAKLGDENVNIAGPTFDGFGPVKVEATYELNRARFSHSVGIDLVGGFTIDILKAQTTGYIGEKLGISFGPLLSFSFPEGGFRVGILQDLYTNAFDVADGAFNTVTDTYEVFYSETLPVIDTEKSGAVQELIAYNEARQINIAASNVTFTPIINGRPAASFLNGNAVDLAGTPQVASWFADRPNASIDMEGNRNSATRDVVRIDVQNQNSVPFVSQLEARFFINGNFSPFPTSGFLSAASATSDAGYLFVNSLPSSSFIDQSGGGGGVAGTRLVYRYGGQQVTTPNSVNILGNAGDDLLVYWGDETQLLDGGGHVAGSATGDVLIANFGRSHVLDPIEWDLRPTAVGQSGQSVGLSLTRGPVLYSRNASEMEKIGFVNDPLQVGGVEIPVGDADGQATLRTPGGELNLDGTFIVRLTVQDTGNGASTFELRVRDAAGNLVHTVGSQIANDAEVGESFLRDLVFKNVELNPSDRIEIVADRGVTEGANAEAARILGLVVHEQHDVSFRNIESFVLTLSSHGDILFTSTFRDRISFGQGEDTLLLTADIHGETMDMGGNADIVLAELKSSTQLGNGTSTNDDIYGQTGADEGIVRNLSNVGAQWVTRTPPLTSGDQIVAGPLGFDASTAQLNAMVGEVARLWNTPFRVNVAAGLPQTSLTGDFIRVQVTENGVTNSVTFTEFEAMSFEGSETADDLAVYFGGTYYRGGASLADTFAADFGTFDRPFGTTTGVVISGFNAAASTAIGAPTTSPFPTAPTRFTYDDGLRFADGGLLRTSEIQGFERLIVTGTAFDDILVGGIYDDYLAGGAGKDILVGGGSRDYDTTFSTVRTNQLFGGDGSDVYYTGGDERTEVVTGTDGVSDLLILDAGDIVSVAAALGDTLVGLRQTFDFIDPGPADVTYQASSSGAALLAAMDQLSAGLVNRDFFFATGSFNLGAFTEGRLRTNLTGLNETDDLFFYDGGATYRGGERPGDADTFVADFSAQTFGVTYNVEQDARGVVLENGVFVSGMDRVVLRLGSGGDLVAGGLLDDVIHGGGGSDVLRGGGAVAGDSLFGGAGADVFGWQVTDGITNVDGGTDAGETAETPIVDRVLISAIDENGASLANPGDGLAVQLFTNLGGGAEDFDPLFLGPIGSGNAAEDIARLLFVQNVATVRVSSGDAYVAMRNIEATEVQGSGAEDDLVWFQNGVFYDGGDRDGDKDVFVAVMLDETADISINARSGDDRVSDDQVFYDIGNGTTIGNFEQIMVRLGSGDDEVFGGDFDDLVEGNDGDDLLDGGAGDDTVSGGAGDDRLFFSGGVSEVIDGGADFDTLEINAIPLGISSVFGLSVNPNDPNDFTITSFNDVNDITSVATMRSELAALMANLSTTNGFFVSGSGTSVRYVNVERVVVSAEEDRDMLVSGVAGGVLSGDGGADVLVSLGGDDLLVGGEGLDRYAFGGAWGNDVIGGEYAGTGEIHFFGWNRFMTGGVISLGGSLDGPQSVSSNGVTDTTSQGAFVTLAALAGFENAVGSNFRDTILGDSGVNKLAGASGDDLLLGFQGDDTLVGGAGIDQVSYAAEGGGGTVTADLATGLVTDSYGNTDRLIEVEWLIGSSTTSFDDLFGDAGDNIFTGNKGAGVDQMDGRAGVDTVDYSAESDTQNYVPGGTTPGPNGFGVVVDLSVVGSFANPNATDTSGHGDLLVNIENIVGSIRDDHIKGGASDNLFVGGDGNDTLDGGPGGFDTVDYRRETGALGVIVDDSGVLSNRDTFGDVDLLIGIERIVGTARDDLMFLDSTFTREAVGGDGDDFIELLISPSAVNGSRLFGGTGDDTLFGADGADYLFGGSGANEAYGFQGDDIYLSTGGTDLFVGGAGDNEVSFELLAGAIRADLTMTEMFTTDTTSVLFGAQRLVVTHSSVSSVTGSAFADAINGDSGSNRLKGGAGDDTIAGGAGVDSLDGGAGVDTLDYTQGAGGVSVDLTIASNNATDGFGARETVTGFERFLGGAFDDTFKGDDRSQTFVTGAGSDKVDGGGGIDTLDLSQESGSFGALFQIVFDSATETFTAVVTDSFGSQNFATSVERFIGTNGVYDDMIGGDGDDTFTGNAGTEVDQMFGGNGVDTVDYSFEGGAQGAVVDLRILGATAATPNAIDSYGDRDALQSIENIVGTAFGDSIDGGAEANLFSGRDGDDSFSGGDGADTIIGGLGLDTIRYDVETGGAGIKVALQGRYPQVVDTFGKVDIVRDIEAIIGSAQSDVMSGDEAANLFTGLAGADRMDGSAGNDILDGGGDGDVLLGWTGEDSLAGGDGDDQLFGENDSDTLWGGSGADVLSGGDGTDAASYLGSTNGVKVRLVDGAAVGSGGDAAGDVLESIENLVGSDGADVLTGDAEDNILSGLGGGDTLDGGVGDDTLAGGAGINRLIGGAGNDTASFASAGSAVAVSLAVAGPQGAGGGGSNTLVGIERLEGSAFGDTLAGNTGANQLDGGAGDDTLAGGAGSDTLVGGLGNDTASFAGQVRVVASLVTGLATGTAAVDTLSGIEGLTGTDGADRLTGAGGDNTLIGGLGDDTLEDTAGDDRFDGGNGVDVVSYAGTAAAVVVTVNGANQITGGAGTDTLIGIENLTGSDYGDTLRGDGGANVLSGGLGNDTLMGGLGDDQLLGSGGRDLAAYNGLGVVSAVTVDLALTGEQNTGGAGFDALSSIEHLIGTNFDDVLKGDRLANTLRGDSGDDNLDGRAGKDMLTGQAGVDTLRGGEGRDELEGGTQNDVLFGDSGDDRLFGNADDDQLTGGVGLDQLRGGLGVDRFFFMSASDSPTTARDQILDFEGASAVGGDVIDLSAIDAVAGGADDAFSFVGSVFTGAAGQLVLQDDGAYSLVLGDLNGDKIADFSIYVLGATPVGVGDLVL